MKKIHIPLAVTAALLLGSTLGAHAQSPVFSTASGVTLVTSSAHPNLVTPADMFTFAIAGFNSTSGVGYILGSGYTATFGTTQTFTGAGYNGQDYTIASSETIGATTTTDTFTVSTPTNFLTTTSVNGTKITALQFDLGDANSGVGVTSGPNPVNLLLPISTYTATGNILYGASNTSFTLTPGTTLNPDGTPSYSAAEGVNNGTTAISGLAVHNFTYSITYSTVPAPEPSQTLAMGLGILGLGALILRRRTMGASELRS